MALPTGGAVEVTAQYAGDVALDGSSSPRTAVSVGAAAAATRPRVTLTGTPRTTTPGGPRVRLVSTVRGSGPRATGTVRFTAQGTVLGRATLRNGRAVLRLPRSTVPGRYRVRAAYAGDASYRSARSVVVQVRITRR